MRHLKYGYLAIYFLVGICMCANVSAIKFLLGSGEIVDAAYSPDNQYIAIVGSVGLQIINADTCEVLRSFTDIQHMNELKWSPNSQTLFITDMSNMNESYVINIDNFGAIIIDEEIKWQFGGSGDIEKQIPIHNNSINFSHDSNELVFVTRNNQIKIYNVKSGELISSIGEIEGVPIAAGFFGDHGDIWFSTSQFIFNDPQLGSVKNNIINLYDRDTRQLSEIFILNDSIPSSKSLIDLRKDRNIIIENDCNSPSIGLYNCTTTAHILDSNNSTSIASASTLFAKGMISFFPNRYLYLPLQNSFVSISVEDEKYSLLAFSDEERIRNVFNFLPVFSHPFNKSATAYLTGEFEPKPVGLPDSPDFGPIFPNYNIYAIDFITVQYEHLLPKTAPELIAFQPDSETRFLTYTNRISRQYMYGEGRTDPTEELPLIPNKFSRPVSQFWSPDDQNVLEEVFDKPFQEIGDFSSNGQLFASPTGEEKGQINIWNTESWEAVHSFKMNAVDAIHHIAFSPNDELLVTISNRVDVHNTASGMRAAEFSHSEGIIFHADWNADSSQLLTAGDDGSVMEWDIASQEGNPIVRDVSPVIFVRYLGDESSILYALEDGATKVYDIQSQSVVHQFDSSLGDHSFRSIKLSPDKQTLFVGNEVWNVQSSELITTIAENARPIQDLQVSDDGKWLATRHNDFTARVWEVEKVLQDQSAINNYNNY